MKTKEKSIYKNCKTKNIFKRDIVKFFLIMFLIIYFGIQNKVYANNAEIKMKIGETVKKELVPDLKYYEVLSLNENGTSKDSLEKTIKTDKYDVSFRLEGAFGDKFVMEITAKKPGKYPQDIQYYIYKKEGEPFTPYRSEILINIEENIETKPEEKPNVTKPENKPKPNNPQKEETNTKFPITSSKVNENVNKTLIKVYPQNAKYLALADVYMREGNSVGTNSITLIPEGTNIFSTGYTENGWIRINYQGKTGFVSSNYIALNKKSDLTEEMEKKAQKEKEEYEKELKKVGLVNSKGETKEKQIEEFKKKIGSIPNVGNNLQFKIFILTTFVSLGLVYIVFKKEMKK